MVCRHGEGHLLDRAAAPHCRFAPRQQQAVGALRQHIGPRGSAVGDRQRIAGGNAASGAGDWCCPRSAPWRSTRPIARPAFDAHVHGAKLEEKRRLARDLGWLGEPHAGTGFAMTALGERAATARGWIGHLAVPEGEWKEQRERQDDAIASLQGLLRHFSA